MTCKEAYDALDVVQRSNIARNVCYGYDNPEEGEAAQVFYDALSKLDGSKRFEMMEQMEFECTMQVLKDNPF